MVPDRAIIVLNIGSRDEDMLLTLHRQATRSHRQSMAAPVAAAPCRASGLVQWPATDIDFPHREITLSSVDQGKSHDKIYSICRRGTFTAGRSATRRVSTNGFRAQRNVCRTSAR